MTHNPDFNRLVPAESILARASFGVVRGCSSSFSSGAECCDKFLYCIRIFLLLHILHSTILIQDQHHRSLSEIVILRWSAFCWWERDQIIIASRYTFLRLSSYVDRGKQLQWHLIPSPPKSSISLRTKLLCPRRSQRSPQTSPESNAVLWLELVHSIVSCLSAIRRDTRFHDPPFRS